MKSQAHNNLEVFLDQKEPFLQNLLNGPNHILLHNLLKDAQYWCHTPKFTLPSYNFHNPNALAYTHHLICIYMHNKKA